MSYMHCPMCGKTGLVCNCRSTLEFNQRERLYTRAEVLAYGERVKDAAKDRHPLMWETLDLAALLDEVKP